MIPLRGGRSDFAVVFAVVGALFAGTNLLPSTEATVLFVGGAGAGRGGHVRRDACGREQGTE